MSGCKVTQTQSVMVGNRWAFPTCDRPVVAHGLCEKHYADRVRLGGGK